MRPTRLQRRQRVLQGPELSHRRGAGRRPTADPAVRSRPFKAKRRRGIRAGRSLGITYGTWRRVVDDAKYPDIAQDAGIIAVDPATPGAQRVERRACVGAPRIRRCAGRRTASGSRSTRTGISPTTSGCGRRPRRCALARRISVLGRGAEVGWPRWSPDGKWLLFDGASKASHRSVMFVAGVDQESRRRDQGTGGARRFSSSTRR